MSYVTRLTHLLNEDYSLPEGDPQMVDEFLIRNVRRIHDYITQSQRDIFIGHVRNVN
jgi:hypothetical protein